MHRHDGADVEECVIHSALRANNRVRRPTVDQTGTHRSDAEGPSAHERSRVGRKYMRYQQRSFTREAPRANREDKWLVIRFP
jgi:hypothetical protein